MTTKTLSSYVSGAWHTPSSGTSPLVNPSTEEVLAHAGTAGVDFRASITHARSVGGPALRALNFAQRGAMLLEVSKLIHAHRDELLDLSTANVGATRGDGKFDVDGAIGTLASYAELGASLGEKRAILDGEGIPLGRGGRLSGQHVLLPRTGVAVHINAFNFPAWGMMEKAAVAWLAGVPVVTKPATATALVAHRIAELVVASKIVPEGAFTFLCGSVGDLLNHLGPQDAVAFTGSSATGASLRVHPAVALHSVRFNVEADSLNAALLGPDVEVGGDAWGIFVGDVAREMTQKAGQKCTAIRRIYAPADRMADVRDALSERLGDVKLGNPAVDGVTMGPLSTPSQAEDVREGIAKLMAVARVAFGGGEPKPIGAPGGKGFFVSPLLLENGDPAPGDAVHSHEVFGPVATLMPYSGTVESVSPLVAAGGGGLVTTLYSDDVDFLREAVVALAPWHGRLCLHGAKVAGQTLPPGAVMPQLVHGGPGRAGGGEELGGMRGMSLYLQRTALQGARAIVERLEI